jgi:hypothetical protein
MDAMPYPVEIDEGVGTVRYCAQISRGSRLRGRFGWRLRSLQGKLLSVLRLLKATLTFEGGVDYILWKIERHTGVRLDVAPQPKRRSLLSLGVMAWHLYRKGGFR